MMFGQCAPFSPEMLVNLYGDLDNYRRLCEESTDRAVAGGFILPEDRDDMVDAVCAIAAKRGLR